MNIPEVFYSEAVRMAEKAADADLGEFSEESYREFQKTGNRTNFENMSFNRRRILNRLLTGELCRGGFIPHIERVIKAILDEATWVLPAHSNGELPDGEEKIIDLFSAQTAAALAIAAERTNISKPLADRIEYEIGERIFKPYIKYDYWWKNLGANRRKNPSNWTPWCTQGVLECARVFNAESAVYEGCMLSIRNYFEDYPNDGGCDEGAQYWGHSAGKFFECGAEGFDKEKLLNMYSYIERVHLFGDMYANYADCAMRFKADPYMIFLMGKAVGSGRLQSFAKTVYEDIKGGDITMCDNMDMRAKLNAIEAAAELEEYAERYTPQSRSIINSLEVGVYRKGSFTVSAKGGNNGENHNHNDCGNVIVLCKNEPVLIDAGVGDYTAETFSDKRYDIWTMQSQYHNLPTINGHMQCDGVRFAAKNTEFGRGTFYCDLTEAYRGARNLKSVERLIEIKESEVVISTEIKFSGHDNFAEFNYILPQRPVVAFNNAVMKNCEMILEDADWEAEEIKTSGDEKLSAVWGDGIWRLHAKIKGGESIKTVTVIRTEKQNM